jgi:alkylhydroperoxidase/carboxymuconolactone decarboxylase family protein YurZ
MGSAPREGVSVEARWADLLWRLSTDERATAGSSSGGGLLEVADEGLRDKTRALVRLAVLIAVDSAPASYQWAVATARSAGAVDDEILGVLLTVGDILDAAWVMSAAAALAPALGCGLDRDSRDTG